MGVDMSIFTEAWRSRDNKEDGWINIDNWRVNKYWTPNADEQGSNEREYHVSEIISDRDYGLFTTLAGVKDYTGRSPKVAAPKGLPPEIDAYTNAHITHHEEDFAYSWLTLAELKAFQAADPIILRSGMISFEQIEALEKGIFPNEWSYWTSREDADYREWEEPNTLLLPLIKLLEEKLKEEFYLISDSVYTPDFDEKIRIVFYFWA